MTTLHVILAIIAAYAVYSIYDARQADVSSQIDAFYQVEQKKCFCERNESVSMGWY